MLTCKSGEMMRLLLAAGWAIDTTGPGRGGGSMVGGAAMLVGWLTGAGTDRMLDDAGGPRS